MPQEFRVTVEQTSELAALELENEIGERAGGHPIAVTRAEPELAPGSVGDPGLINVVLSYAADAVPVVVAAFAAWVTAGRKRRTTRARKIVVTDESMVIAEIEVAELERAGSADALAGMLDGLLKGSADGAPRA